ncbi:MAG: MFS transporter [Kaiparowitsia implicata GSE-PSE-MK54-09C]|jgi:MFS family permease|nr:MFS transporter [Kaiparowitsia implicata GSE-PSE-MK54-09C]
MGSPEWYRSLDAQGRTAFWSSYAGLSVDAMSVQLYAFVLPILLGVWGLSTTGAGLLASSALLTGAIGGWLAGSLSDRFGRIRVLRLSIVWVVVATMLCGLARNYNELLLARLLQGIGFGAEWAVGVVFMSEFSRDATRGRTLGTLQSAWASGWGLAAATTAVAVATLPVDIGWRVVFFVGVAPAIILFRRRLAMSDSPAFAATTERRSWHGIFAQGIRLNTFKGCLLATGMHGGYWAIATWWPTMLLLERGLPASEVWLHTAVMILGSFAGYAMGAWASDRIGRRATLAGFALGGMATVIILTQLPLPTAFLLALTPLLGLFALGVYSAVGPVLTELYPTALRGSGLGFCYNVGRGLAGATPLAVGGAIASLGFSRAIGLYVAISYGMVFIAAWALRETRGISLTTEVSERVKWGSYSLARLTPCPSRSQVHGSSSAACQDFTAPNGRPCSRGSTDGLSPIPVGEPP